MLKKDPYQKTVFYEIDPNSNWAISQLLRNQRSESTYIKSGQSSLAFP